MLDSGVRGNKVQSAQSRFILHVPDLTDLNHPF